MQRRPPPILKRTEAHRQEPHGTIRFSSPEMSATSLLHLPTENIEQILREVPDDDSHRGLIGILGTNYRLNRIARPIAYRDVTLFQPRAETDAAGVVINSPHKALDTQAELLSLKPDIGTHIQTLSFEGRSTDPGPHVYDCSTTSEAAVLNLCRRAPRLVKLYLKKLFWLDRKRRLVNEALNSVTHLSISQATFLGTEPIPATVARHFVDLQSLSIGTAPGTIVDPEFISALREETIDIRSLTFEPSYPFQTELVEALLEASEDTLDDFTLYLPLIAAPDDFLVPEELFIPDNSAIRKFSAVLPLCLFPALFDVRDTWHFLAITIMSAIASIDHAKVIFDVGRCRAQQIARRIDALPTTLIEGLLEELGMDVMVEFELRGAQGAVGLSLIC